MLKIGIVDDQQLYLDKIEDILVNNYDDLKVFKYNSVSEINQDMDFLLLDIDMPDEDGINFSKTHQDIKIVFVTNYDTRIKEAFGPNIYGYVSKINLKEELIEKVNEMIKIVRRNHYLTLRVYEHLNGDGIVMNLRLDDMIYFQYIGNRSIAIICNNKQRIVKNITFTDLLSNLDDRFLLINRDTIINGDKIIKIKNNLVWLKGVNSVFEISRRQRKSTLRYYYENSND